MTNEDKPGFYLLLYMKQNKESVQRSAVLTLCVEDKDAVLRGPSYTRPAQSDCTAQSLHDPQVGHLAHWLRLCTIERQKHKIQGHKSDAQREHSSPQETTGDFYEPYISGSRPSGGVTDLWVSWTQVWPPHDPRTA